MEKHGTYGNRQTTLYTWEMSYYKNLHILFYVS